jgi:hypothetical protein
MKKLGIVAAVVTFGVLFVLSMCMSPVVSAGTYTTALVSTNDGKAPVLDGNISAGEWSGAGATRWYFFPLTDNKDNYIDIFVKNTNDTLYICLDLTPYNSTNFFDNIGVAFDENHDGYFNTWYGDDTTHKGECM